MAGSDENKLSCGTWQKPPSEISGWACLCVTTATFVPTDKRSGSYKNSLWTKITFLRPSLNCWELKPLVSVRELLPWRIRWLWTKTSLMSLWPSLSRETAISLGHFQGLNVPHTISIHSLVLKSVIPVRTRGGTVRGSNCPQYNLVNWFYREHFPTLQLTD